MHTKRVSGQLDSTCIILHQNNRNPTHCFPTFNFIVSMLTIYYWFSFPGYKWSYLFLFFTKNCRSVTNVG